MFKKHFTHGEDIIRFGEIGREYFILATGRVKVTLYTQDTNPFDPNIQNKIAIVKELVPEPDLIGFGEIALLLNDRRPATVTAVSKEGCDTWVLSAEVFKYVVAAHTLKRRNINLSYLI